MSATDQTVVGLAVVWVLFCVACFVASCFEPHACDHNVCPHRSTRGKR